MRTRTVIQNLKNDPFKWSSLLRFDTVLPYFILIIASVGIAVSVATFGAAAGFIIIAFLLGVPAAIYTIFNIKFGVIILLVIAFFLSRVNTLAGDVPLGISIDVFLLLMFVGVAIRKWRRSDFSVAKSVISYLVWIWLIYNALELFNPMASLEAWIYIIRALAGHMLLYFIMLEALDDITFFRKLIILWIVLAFLGGAYGLFQEFHGLLQSEKDWVLRDEERFRLFYNWGRYRIFSFFNDPTVFGILMSFTGLFCLTLLHAPIKILYKVLLVIAAVVMIMASMYSGTRTAYAMLPAGFVIYALITFQKKTIIFTSVIMIIASLIVFSDVRSVGPFLSANTLERIRSAFKPSEDPSYLVRMENQSRIKPFIHSHPLGAGLGSIGAQGERFNPNSSLAGFDADSMYVRVAVELGWIGLVIYCIFISVVLVTGIKNYYRARDPEIKAYLAGIIAVIYAITIANYTQMAAIQLPNVLIFYALIASIIKLAELDTKPLK